MQSLVSIQAASELGAPTTTASLRKLGTGANDACAGADARLGRHALSGLQMSYVSATSISVSPGYCPDSTNTASLVLASGQTLTTGGFGADAKTLTGTVVTNSGNATVTGTSTLFMTEFGTRTMTGTITSGSTTVTGTSTKFLTEIAVNDLIGTGVKGYYAVTGVASDTSLTISSAPGSAFAGETPDCIEQPVFRAGSQTVRLVATITSNTALTLTANSSATGSTLTAKTGVPFFGDGTNNFFYHVFVCSSAGGTVTTFFSPQRTTPFCTGTYPYFKRLGAVVLDTGGNVIPFLQSGGNRRETHFMIAAAANNSRVLSSGSATTFTTLSCRQVVPPTSNLALLRLICTAAITLNVRPSNLPSPPTAGVYDHTGIGGNTTDGFLYAFTDWQQQIDYFSSAVSSAAYIDVNGFVETLP